MWLPTQLRCCLAGITHQGSRIARTTGSLMHWHRALQLRLHRLDQLPHRDSGTAAQVEIITTPTGQKVIEGQ